MSERVRCAIYTRKSTEEGLEQEFNSLDAQREACEAYIQSQRGQGWVVQRKRYDDGGISGGTMDRPALQDLLADIGTGAVDLVVVYKVDRLTRSLTDFARIVETFDARGVSFVSVTQQFNTANSMGRLTLHVLLSFAQFEREVTAERIRDKIAASKKKGLWMGGPVPLGYDVKDRRLVANRIEADTVNRIFRLYGELGTVRRLKDELDRLGIVTKRRVHKTGKQTGGKPFSRGNLYQLLSNPIYIGRIAHKGETYPGEHDAIVELDTWEAVRNLLAQNAVGRTRKTNVRSSFLLTGKVFDENGAPLYLSQAHAHGRRYGYYISRHLMHGAHRNAEGWRIPARTLEHVVTASLSDLCRSEARVMDLMNPEEPGLAALTGLKARAAGLSDRLSNGPLEERRGILHAIIQRIDLTPTSIVSILHKTALARLLDLPYPDDRSCVSIRVPIRLRRRGVATKTIVDSSDAGTCNVDPDLCRLIAQAHLWFDRLASGEACTVREIAGREKINEHEITRVLHLAFLSPRIVEDIFKGRQAEDVTVYRLRRLSSLPFAWQEQAERLENLG